MAKIHATQHIWAPRGTTTHRALELALLQRFHPQLDSACASQAELADLVSELETLRQSDYAAWIEPLITHDHWNHVTVIASERPTCCLTRGVAGTFDTAYQAGSKRVLADLKTLASETSHTYCTRAQLGGYMALEATWGNHYDYGQTIWARPGRTAFSDLYSRRECLLAWAAAWTRYQAASCLL